MRRSSPRSSAAPRRRSCWRPSRAARPVPESRELRVVVARADRADDGPARTDRTPRPAAGWSRSGPSRTSRRVYCADLPANLGACVPNDTGPASAIRAVRRSLRRPTATRDPDLAVRLQMKLGVIAEPDRASDSPDTVVIVEPTIGAIARSKGNLYLIVTSTVASAKAQEATQLAAESIRGEYYYDESAGIRVCIEKAIASANKRLNHQRDRLGLHGTERQRPDRDRDRGRPQQRAVRRDDRPGRGVPDPPGPAVDAAGPPSRARPPDRRPRAGRLARRDLRRRLARPRLAERHDPARARRAQGRDGHAPPAAGDGAPPPPLPRGRRRRQRRDDRVRGDRGGRRRTGRGRSSRSGRPSRWPALPIARRSRSPTTSPAASRPCRRRPAGRRPPRAACSRGVLTRLQDLMPHRRTAYRRVTPAVDASARPSGAPPWRSSRSSSSSAAWRRWSTAFGGRSAAARSRRSPRRRPRCGRSATDLGQVFAPGRRPRRGRPRKAMSLLTDAYRAVDAAKSRERPAGDARPAPASRSSAGSTGSSTSCRSAARRSSSFAGAKTPFDIQAMILGPDGMPYVLDKASASVYRIDLRTKKATLVFRQKTKAAGATARASRSCSRPAAATSLIVDDKNVVWRWRAADDKGNGTTRTVKVAGCARLGRRRRRGRDVPAGRERGPLQPVRRRPVGAEHPRLHPGARRQRLPGQPAEPADASPATSRRSTDLLIDGDIFVADGGSLFRFVGGKSEGWETQPPGYTSDRAATATRSCARHPDYALIASASDKRTGRPLRLGHDNGRVVAYDKAKGTFIEQYRLAGGSPAWHDVRGMYVVLRVRAGGAVDARLGDEGRRDVGGPRGRAGRRAGRVGLAEPVRLGADRLREAVRQARRRRQAQSAYAAPERPSPAPP